MIDLANTLADRGHVVHLACRPGSPVPSRLSLPKGDLLELPLRSSLDLPSARRLARFVTQNNVDVIHAHLARDYPLAALAARFASKPYVLTRHVLFPLNRLHRSVIRNTARIIAVSNAVRRSLLEQQFVPPERIVMVHNGIDVDRFASGPSETPPQMFGYKDNKRKNVGMAGHLSPIKGQDVFLRAAAIVSNQRDDVDFVIAGEDKSRSGENRVQIEQLTTELGLADRVHSLGWVHDLRDFYNSLDVFVSPSRIEPFGLVILEAMACRIPVIATASEGATEIIEQGMTGRLVPVEDHHALADEILNLLDSDPERKRLSHNAFVVTKDRFSLASMVDATENVYADILKERRA